jgi:hypothetical protein
MTRILVVANRTAVAPRLLDEIRRRARDGACEFTLLIPEAGRRSSHDWRMENALPLLRRAALRCPVDGMVAESDPFTAVREAVAGGRFDEILVSTLPPGASRWLRRDLVRRIERLGLPVTHIMPRGGRPSNREAFGTLLEVGAAGGAGVAVPRANMGDRERQPTE